MLLAHTISLYCLHNTLTCKRNPIHAPYVPLEESHTIEHVISAFNSLSRATRISSCTSKHYQEHSHACMHGHAYMRHLHASWSINTCLHVLRKPFICVVLMLLISWVGHPVLLSLDLCLTLTRWNFIRLLYKLDL